MKSPIVPLYPQSAKWGQKTPQLLAKIPTCWPPLVLLVLGRPAHPLRKQTCWSILFSTSQNKNQLFSKDPRDWILVVKKRKFGWEGEEICWRRKRHIAEKEKKVAGEGKQIWRKIGEGEETRSSWLNCALRGDEPVCWVRIGQQGLVLGGTESIKGGTG